jgi:aspartate-semialdehyde dehydrogenase
MKSRQGSYRVAIVGASSLLGKEVAAVLEERHFPVSRLLRIAGDEDEPELPILDLQGGVESASGDEDLSTGDPDFVFLAARPRELPSFLQTLKKNGRPECAVIHLVECQEAAEGEVAPPSIPFLEGRPARRGGAGAATHIVSAHPATIVLSTLLLRLAARFPVRSAVAQVFSPASELGSRAIEELQKQTVNLLSFQKIPRAVFGGQLAFNVLPRLGRGGHGGLADLEAQVRRQLAEYLKKRAPLPALHVVQIPVFYALACSLYVETAETVTPAEAAAALAGARVRLSRLTEDAPTQVDAAGSSDILVDAVTPDPAHPKGVWIWAAVDNIRLAAVNAVEIAESLRSSAASLAE